jgi:hypothetical protein
MCSLVEFPAASIITAFIIEAASISEMSINFYQTTRCKNQEDSHLHIRRRENLKSCNGEMFIRKKKEHGLKLASLLLRTQRVSEQNKVLRGECLVA